MIHFIYEQFNSIQSLLSTIESRPNNEVMKDNHSSEKTSDAEWSGTKSYDEAKSLLRNGYTDILPQIKESMKISSSLYQNHFVNIPRKRPENSVVGFTPNVPNAIQNLPQSMINIKNIPQKRKALEVIYFNIGSYGEETSHFIDAGVALLTAINILEARGLSVKINLSFMAARKADEMTCPVLTIKDYGQKLDLQKICFPIAHPSMLRRIGFKYLETCPELTEEDFAYGYGNPLSNLVAARAELKNKGIDSPVLSTYWIQENDCDANKIIEYLTQKV